MAVFAIYLISFIEIKLAIAMIIIKMIFITVKKKRSAQKSQENSGKFKPINSTGINCSFTCAASTLVVSRF